MVSEAVQANASRPFMQRARLQQRSGAAVAGNTNPHCSRATNVPYSFRMNGSKLGSTGRESGDLPLAADSE
jgi:hypothetical protein